MSTALGALKRRLAPQHKLQGRAYVHQRRCRSTGSVLSHLARAWAIRGDEAVDRKLNVRKVKEKTPVETARPPRASGPSLPTNAVSQRLSRGSMNSVPNAGTAMAKIALSRSLGHCWVVRRAFACSRRCLRGTTRNRDRHGPAAVVCCPVRRVIV